MESQLIRILPACFSDPLPEGWDSGPEGFVIEVMPEVERPEVVELSIQTTEPDVLLLNADFPDLNAFELTQQVLTTREGLAVILVSENNSPDQLRQAMLAGAEEFLIKPLDAKTLSESIVQIASHRTLRVVQEFQETTEAEPAEGLIVAVVSGKGGLGKTTVATNLAALIGKASEQPCGLIGFESGDGAVMLQLQPKLGLLDLIGSLQDADADYSPEWIKQFAERHRTGVHYWTWQGAGTHGGSEIPDDFIANFFNVCRRACNYTFVDFPLLSEDEAAAVLPHADVILLVSSSSDLLAMKATKTFLDAVPVELRQRVRVVINRAHESDMISRDDFEETLEQDVAAVLPNQPEIAAQAINMGSPFVLTQPQSELSTSVRKLSQKLFKVPEEIEDDKPRRKFMLFSVM